MCILIRIPSVKLKHHLYYLVLERYSSFVPVNTHLKSSVEKYNVYSWNSTITSYFKRGETEMAQQLFDEMPIRNLVTWNCMISGYVLNKRIVEAHRIFDAMPRKNVVSWTALITGYARSRRLDEARALFDEMLERNVVCWNAMISAYINYGKIEEATELFEMMPERNLLSWAIMIGGHLRYGLVVEAQRFFDRAPRQTTSLCNAMLSGYVEVGLLEDALKFFNKMPYRDIASWTAMITCYSQKGQMENAARLFEEMPERDIIAWTALIRGYLHNGKVRMAHNLFNKMPQRDVVAWNSMIGGYIHNGMMEEALQLFMQMPRHDIVSWNSILQGYVGQGDMVNACLLFGKMPQRDETSWNTMISGFQCEESLDLFSMMIKEGFRPDQGTFTSIISICASLASLGWGRMVHACVIKAGYEHDTLVCSSLVTMYSKCGSVIEATQVFTDISKKDTVAWNAMIIAQAYNGSTVNALELFSAMRKEAFEPDHVTFLGLLSACVHGGLVDQGWQYFNMMQTEWNLIPKPEHYACMVDLLGRNGLLSQAYEFIKQIPLDVSSHAWETLLSACRVHGNVELGEVVANKILSLQPLEGGIYVMLSNLYVEKGMWEHAKRIRVLMKERGAQKQPGHSWIEIRAKTYAFISGDRSHPHIKKIYNLLEILAVSMEEIGYFSYC